MRKISLRLFYIIISIFVLSLLASAAQGTFYPSSWQVYFSPKGGCAEKIVEELGNAKESVLVHAYLLSSGMIIKGLKDASARGVKVRLVLDGGQLENKRLKEMVDSGLFVKLDFAHEDNKGLNHNKVMIIDNRVVITGSFNFTYKAENYHAENLLLIKDGKLAAAYTANWKEHAGHSEDYLGK